MEGGIGRSLLDGESFGVVEGLDGREEFLGGEIGLVERIGFLQEGFYIRKDGRGNQWGLALDIQGVPFIEVLRDKGGTDVLGGLTEKGKGVLEDQRRIDRIMTRLVLEIVDEPGTDGDDGFVAFGVPA